MKGAPNIKVKILEHTYNSLEESHVMMGGNLGLEGGWKK
jgi:hypothetical protein